MKTNDYQFWIRPLNEKHLPFALDKASECLESSFDIKTSGINLGCDGFDFIYNSETIINIEICHERLLGYIIHRLDLNVQDNRLKPVLNTTRLKCDSVKEIIKILNSYANLAKYFIQISEGFPNNLGTQDNGQ